jgi:hypothetical protein
MIALSCAGFGTFASLPVFRDPAHRVPARCRGGRRHRHQLDRQHGRICRTVRDGIDQDVMGSNKDPTGSFTIGLPAIDGLVLLSMLLALSLPRVGDPGR